MLLSLHIKNYALIEDLRLELAEGLNIFTGETGAGKSIIIDSLGLILGARASGQAVRKDAQRCFITGEFDISALKEAKTFLDRQGLPDDDTLIIRREIDAASKSRAFVNDTPVSISTLSELGNLLVDIHGQHEHQALFSTVQQRKLLDSFGAHEKALEILSKKYAVWRQLKMDLEAGSISEAERNRLIDLYSFQVREIDEAKPGPQEEEEIESALPTLKNAEKLKNMSGEAYQALYGSEASVLSGLSTAKKLVENINTLCGALGGAASSLESAYYQIEEASREINAFDSGLNSDPDKLNEMLTRRDLLNTLKKKYGGTISDVIAYRDKTASELNSLTQSDANRQDLEKKLESALKDVERSCAGLSESRKKAALKLDAGTQKELADLGMKKAHFEVPVQQTGVITEHGWDKTEFLFCPNPGENLMPLKNIASGGEISRVMLAIKTVLAKSDGVPVLVFDEIDAGLGGPMGQTVGKKLKSLSGHHQLICITHLPQIAAFADRHFTVYKENKAGRTQTACKQLDRDRSLEEIARMLSGAEITPSARKHAEELVKQSI